MAAPTSVDGVGLQQQQQQAQGCSLSMMSNARVGPLTGLAGGEVGGAFLTATSGNAKPKTGAVSTAGTVLPAQTTVEQMSPEEQALLQQFNRVLEYEISSSFECVTYLSGVLLSRACSPTIYFLLQAWESSAALQQSDEKMLALLYVMNDALQKCRRRGCPLLLLLSLQPLMRFCKKAAAAHESILPACRRVIRIMRDAQVFGAPAQSRTFKVAAAFLAVLQKNEAAAAELPLLTVEDVLSADDSSTSAHFRMPLHQQQQVEEGATAVATGGLRRRLSGSTASSLSHAGAGRDTQHQRVFSTPAVNGAPPHASFFPTLQPQQKQHTITSTCASTPAAASNTTTPSVVDTFLVQYPVAGDEPLAAYVDTHFPEDPAEAQLRHHVAEALAGIAALRTALTDKASARRRIERRVMELQHEQQQLKEQGARLQQVKEAAAAAAAERQGGPVLLWQQVQQLHQQQEGRGSNASLKFESVEEVAVEEARVAALLAAAKAKLKLLTKTEWNKRIELQKCLLQLSEAIEKRLEKTLLLHVRCREVKSVLDRAVLVQATRQNKPSALNQQAMQPSQPELEVSKTEPPSSGQAQEGEPVSEEQPEQVLKEKDLADHQPEQALKSEPPKKSGILVQGQETPVEPEDEAFLLQREQEDVQQNGGVEETSAEHQVKEETELVMLQEQEQQQGQFEYLQHQQQQPELAEDGEEGPLTLFGGGLAGEGEAVGEGADEDPQQLLPEAGDGCVAGAVHDRELLFVDQPESQQQQLLHGEDEQDHHQQDQPQLQFMPYDFEQVIQPDCPYPQEHESHQQH